MQIIDRSAAALSWFDHGWPVFPLPARAKKSPPEGVTGHAGVDYTRPQLALMDWSGNLGVRMPVDVIGLDVDDYENKPGAKTLAELIEKLGPLPPTVRSTSRRRNDDGTENLSGIRLYRVPVGLRWISGLPGIEIIQRDYRYAAVWPSMHPLGRQYQLYDEADEANCGIPYVGDLPDLPWSWIGYLSRPADGEDKAPSRAVSTEVGGEFLDAHTTGTNPSYIAAIVEHFNTEVDEGRSRHDSMQHCLTWAMESAAAGLIGAMDAAKALGAAWEPRHDDARRRQLVNEHRTTEFEAMIRHAIGKALGKSEPELAALRLKVAGPAIGVASIEPEPEPEHESSSIWLDWQMVRSGDEIEQDWLVEGFWPARRAMALWAKAKTGKSELALWIAGSLAIGRDPFTGAAIEPVDVAYFDYEMTLDDVRERLDEFGILERNLDHLHYALLPPLPALDVEAGGQAIIERVREVGARAVVIDTFGRAVVGDEDRADTVRAFYRYTGSRLKQLSIGYVRTDHGGKNPDLGQRGSSAKYDDVDVIWKLTKTQAGCVLDCTAASRLSWVGPLIHLDRHVRADAITYRRVATESIVMVDDHVVQKMKQLDSEGIPLDWGRDKVVAELKQRGLEVGRWSVLSDAIKARRVRLQPVPEHHHQNGPGTG